MCIKLTLCVKVVEQWNYKTKRCKIVPWIKTINLEVILCKKMVEWWKHVWQEGINLLLTFRKLEWATLYKQQSLRLPWASKSLDIALNLPDWEVLFFGHSLAWTEFVVYFCIYGLWICNIYVECYLVSVIMSICVHFSICLIKVLNAFL